MSDLKKEIGIKTVASVISAVILAILGSFVTWILPGGWGAAWDWVKTGWNAARLWVGASNTPNWLLLILGLGTAGFIFLLVVIVLAARRAAKNRIKPELRFMGLIWRWQIRRRSDRDEMVNVIAFCPVCEMQLHPTRVRDVPRNHTKFICDRCPGHPERFDLEGNVDEVEDLVIREAQRQMRLDILGKTPETQAPPMLTPQPGEVQETLFEGLRWRWQFQGGELINIETVCPACFAPLPPFQENEHCPTLYRCRSCRAEIKVFVGTHADLQARFARCVKQEVRGV